MEFPNYKIGLTDITPCNPWSMVYWTKARYIKYLQKELQAANVEYVDNSAVWPK